MCEGWHGCCFVGGREEKDKENALFGANSYSRVYLLLIWASYSKFLKIYTIHLLMDKSRIWYIYTTNLSDVLTDQMDNTTKSFTWIVKVLKNSDFL